MPVGERHVVPSPAAQPPCPLLPVGFPGWRWPWGPAGCLLARGGSCASQLWLVLGAYPAGVGVTGSHRSVLVGPSGRHLWLLSRVPSWEQ